MRRFILAIGAAALLALASVGSVAAFQAGGPQHAIFGTDIAISAPMVGADGAAIGGGRGKSP